MAQPYCVSQMLCELAGTEIPNAWEQEFVSTNQFRKAKDFSVAQYNKVIDLYNKYIAVAAAVPAYKYNGDNRL